MRGVPALAARASLRPSPRAPRPPHRHCARSQMLYVSREHGVVVAKNAAYPEYEKHQRPGTHENYVETTGYHALRAIAKHYAGA